VTWPAESKIQNTYMYSINPQLILSEDSADLYVGLTVVSRSMRRHLV